MIATNGRLCHFEKSWLLLTTASIPHSEDTRVLQTSKTAFVPSIKQCHLAERYGVVMTSNEMRENPLFMRHSFASAGKWGISLVRKQYIQQHSLTPYIVVKRYFFSTMGKNICTKDIRKTMFVIWRFNSIFRGFPNWFGIFKVLLCKNA